MLSDMSLKEFLEKLSSNEPAPGGGSAAALAGSIAASLGCMVANLTIGKKKYEEVEEEMKNLKVKLEEYRDKFLQLMEEDAEAFNEVIDALKLPKSTEEEKKARNEKIQEKTKKATLVPLQIAKDALEVMELSGVTIEKGYKMAKSDAAISLVMAKAAVEGGLYNVKINLPSIKDEDFLRDINSQIEKIEGEANTLQLRLLSKANI
ncbi:methenyltetrahydrofolate cyclohydrolase [Petrotoga miotherma DSM 10691]|uniref:Methenyltetrahydrofolate cyclohydrolase n=1 Tax=Petrotoga miotherma DSM 10691 TaxID=1434326 RepID=A0A2K1PGW9_9BACT|nr:cyclodeaminase/cyclohydrolase family protein [Petrotoga miotherma]PNR92079.1 methenyltetrahydrofolate cyclohydrolase [Petrotoga sp. HWHPT.55.6.3]PNS02009.1 methenyltetrahydrofolate cyclohydrolase [Petrotoga miotherma DSM 10691]RPD35682.1 methenyltetrahydrofolate cyclohydrolase [Petrotoga sp. HWH.PT.55.6.1]